MHIELATALRALFKPGRAGPVITSVRSGQSLHANSVVNWFAELYFEVRANGCSSHSGRRTFITFAARQAPLVGASLRDVQLLAGHKSIEVTQAYIDSDTHAQRRLIARL
jgi:integrase/recombinase XerD